MKNQFRKISLNQVGMSMVQVMIAAGIAAGIALMLAKVTQNSQKEVKRIEARNEINRVHNNIMSALKDEASCTFLLRDLAIDELADIPSIDFGANPAGGTALPQIYRCRRNKTEDWVGNGSVPDGVREVYCDDAVAGNPQTIYRLGFNEGNVDGSDASDFGAIRLQDIKLYRNANQGDRVEVMVNYFVHGSVDAGGKQRASGVSNIVKRFPVQVNEMEAVTAANAVAPDTGHPLNTGSMVRCNFDDIDFINTAVERSCIGNTALLTQDANGRNICLHEMRIPNCDNGEVLVYKGDTDVVFDSVTPNPVTDNASGPVFRCAKIANMECGPIIGVGESYLPVALATGPVPHSPGDPIQDPNETDLLGDQGEYRLECLRVPNCDTNNNGQLDAGEGELVFTDDGTGRRHGKFECLQRKCGAGEIGVYGANGFECKSCSAAGGILIGRQNGANTELECKTCTAGQILVQTTTGWECKTPSCPDYDYFAGFDGSGNPICIDNEVDCSMGQGDQAQEKRYLKSFVVNSDGTVTADCCTPNCNNASNVCYGKVFPEPNGCRFCIGEKEAVNNDWNEWTLSEGPASMAQRDVAWNTDWSDGGGYWGPNKLSCRAKDGGSVTREAGCQSNEVECGGYDACFGDTLRIDSTPCNAALEEEREFLPPARRNPPSFYIYYNQGYYRPSGKFIVPGTLRFITVGGGGGGAGSEDNNGGNAGESAEANNYGTIPASAGTVGSGTSMDTYIRYQVGGAGLYGNRSERGRDGTASYITYRGSTGIHGIGSSPSTYSGGGRGGNGRRGNRTGGHGGASFTTTAFGKTVTGTGGGGGGRESACGFLGSGAEAGRHATDYGAGGGGGGTSGTCATRGGQGGGGYIWIKYKYTTY
jgi:hypothetical protein